MSKHNFFSKGLKKHFLSINNTIESYFNKLKFFILNFKKIKSQYNNKGFIIFGIFFIYPLLFPVYCKHMKLYSRLLISLSLFLLFNTQYFTNMLIFTLLTFYGLAKYKNMNNDLKEH